MSGPIPLSLALLLGLPLAAIASRVDAFGGAPPPPEPRGAPTPRRGSPVGAGPGPTTSSALSGASPMVSDAVTCRWTPERPRPGQAVRFEVHLPDGWALDDLFLDRLPVALRRAGPRRWVGRAGIGRRESHGPRELLLAGSTERGTPFFREETLRVLPGSYPVEVLEVPEALARPPVDAWRRIYQEGSARHWRAEGTSLLPPPPLPWARPVDGRVTSRFGKGRVFNGRPGVPHLGTDFAGGVGTPVVAVSDGRVVTVREEYLGGLTVRVDHGGGWVSHCMHLSETLVGVGDHLRRGDVLGRVGRSGRVTGPHLHFAVSWRGRYLDPSALLTGKGGDP